MTVDELKETCTKKLNAMYKDNLSIYVFGLGEYFFLDIAENVLEEHCDGNKEEFEMVYVDLIHELQNERQ